MASEIDFGGGGLTVPSNVITCAECSRSVTTDLLADPALLSALVGWSFADGRVLCAGCQWARGEAPNFARRLRITNPIVPPLPHHAARRPQPPL